jgi:RNase P/RNase MRP subunit p30
MNDINLFKKEGSIFLKKIKSKQDIKSNDTCGGYLIKSSEKNVRSIIASLASKKEKKVIALLGEDDAFNRRAIETLKINYLVSPERGFKKDTLKQRDSGLNHVVAKEAKKKGIAIIINFSEIPSLKGKEKAIRLEKIIQNIKICRKAGCKIKIASLAKDKISTTGKNERKALGTSLGMSSEQTKNSIKF